MSSVLGRLVLGRSGPAQGETLETSSGFSLDATILATDFGTGSFTFEYYPGEDSEGDGFLRYGHVLLDAVTLVPDFGTGSWISRSIFKKEQAGSLTVTAIRKQVFTVPVTVNAVIMRPSRAATPLYARPNSDFAKTGTITPTSGTDAWAMVDEVVLNTGDSYHMSVQATISHGMTDVPLHPEATIDRIVYTSYIGNGAPAGTAHFYIKNPTTGLTYHIRGYGQNSFGQFTDSYATRPWDGLSWTQSDVQGLQIMTQGAEIISPTTFYWLHAAVYFTAPLTFSADAIKHEHHERTFTVSSWFRHEFYAEFSSPLEAIRQETFSFPDAATLDAVIPRNFQLDANIYGSLISGIRLTGVQNSSFIGSNPTWTHRSAAGDSALMVITQRVGFSDPSIWWVTYGGIPMRQIGYATAHGTTVWFLDDIGPRANDIVVTSTSISTTGTSLMLSSQNTISVAAFTRGTAVNHNGQTLTDTYSTEVLARYLVAIATATPTSGATTWDDAFDLGAGMVMRRNVAISTNFDAGILSKDGGVSSGTLSGSVAVTTTVLTDFISILLTSQPSEGTLVYADAVILGTRTGSWISRSVIKKLAQTSSFSIDYEWVNRVVGSFGADATIKTEPVVEFTLDWRVRLAEYFESSFSLDAWVPVTVEDAYSLDAYIATALYYDSIDAAVGIAAPVMGGGTLRITGNQASFTTTATDPWPASSHNNTAWLRLDVSEAGMYRIDNYGSGPLDTMMAIWGPQAVAPTDIQEPWHYSDDGDSSDIGDSIDRWRSGFSDEGQSFGEPGFFNYEPNGTNYDLGDDDAFGIGITLGVGSYWIVTSPWGAFADGGEGPSVVNITRMVRQTGTLTVDAFIECQFKLNAVIALHVAVESSALTEWVTLTTVLGALPGLQPASPVTLISQAGGGISGVARVITKPVNMVSGDIIFVFVSGDEQGSQRGVLIPGFEQYYYAPSGANHDHAAWILYRRVHAWEPSSYTVYWDGQVFAGAMAVTFASFRNAGPGRVVTVTDVPALSSGATNRTALSWAYPGHVMLAAFYASAASAIAISIASPLSQLNSAVTSFAQLRVGRTTTPFTSPQAVQYSAVQSASSVQLNTVLNVVPYPARTGFPLDAFITRWHIEAIIGKTTTATFTADATSFLPTILGSFSMDTEWHHGFDFAYLVLAIIPGSTVARAVKFSPDFGQGTFTGNAVLAYKRLFILRASIYAPTTETFALDAVILQIGGRFGIDAWLKTVPGATEQFYGYTTVDAVKRGVYPFTLDAYYVPRIAKRGWFSVDAFLRILEFPFTLDAWIGPPPSTVSSSFTANALIGSTGQVTYSFEGDEGYGIDAVVDSYWSETTFTIDATVVESMRVGSFSAGADLSAVGEVRGAFALDTNITGTTSSLFVLRAVISSGFFHLDSWLSATFTLDAAIAFIAGTGTLTASAWLKSVTTSSFSANADLSAVGDKRGVLIIEAALIGSQSGSYIVSASLVKVGANTFTVDAILRGRITLDAFIGTMFYVNAYIASAELIVYPPSQEGEGSADGSTTFTDPDADFTPDLIGETIVIGGEPYVITGVPSGTSVTVDTAIPPGSSVSWAVPSGAATDALGGPPPVTRRNRIRILWARPFTDDWHDITGDVMWDKTRFTQAARVGAGTFELHLEGAWPVFVGGEEIRVEVDGFVVFGGYTMDVTRGFIFSDYAAPTTALRGTDYNIVLDKLVVYNADWDESHGPSGEYRNWQPFARDTSDQHIIRTIARDYIARMPGFDFHTYVDEIESPAPTKKWTMQAGTTLRDVLTEISRITEGVWWIDPYRNLQYHDRGIVTAPFPITDGDGGISCRELTLGSDISIVANDVIAWGTESYESGDSTIIYNHQQADETWSVLFWEDKIDDTQERIDNLRDVPYDERTTKQRADLAALKRAKTVYQNKLAKAQAQGGQGSIQRFGRWQYAEFRQDIHKSGALERRATAIMRRYGEPVQKGSATIFDHGFQAGQVAFVSSVTHGVADEMPIREMTIDFAVVKEPDGELYYAVPRYALSLGLDPEEPWNVYQFLPFNWKDYPGPHWNPPGGWWLEPGEEPGQGILDDFTRDYLSETDFGTATNDRDEIRNWEDLP